MVRIGALFATVFLAGCWPPCDDEGYDVTSNLFVQENDPAEASIIAACFANDSSCERLCMDLLGPPPAETIRDIKECTVTRDGGGGLQVFARSHLVKKCSDDWSGDDTWDWNIYPDAQGWPDAYRSPDATPPDAQPDFDAAPGV